MPVWKVQHWTAGDKPHPSSFCIFLSNVWICVCHGFSIGVHSADWVLDRKCLLNKSQKFISIERVSSCSNWALTSSKTLCFCMTDWQPASTFYKHTHTPGSVSLQNENSHYKFIRCIILILIQSHFECETAFIIIYGTFKT